MSWKVSEEGGNIYVHLFWFCKKLLMVDPSSMVDMFRFEPQLDDNYELGCKLV